MTSLEPKKVGFQALHHHLNIYCFRVYSSPDELISSNTEEHVLAQHVAYAGGGGAQHGSTTVKVEANSKQHGNQNFHRKQSVVPLS